jgi:hypothetical protein
MFWIYACWIVAFVTYEQMAIQIESFEQMKRYAMGELCFTAKRQIAISITISSSLPIPASRQWILGEVF